MKLISHRGNINGKDPSRENRFDYINDALDAGYEVEIDVWYEDKQWWLGHDEPTYKTGTSILRNPKIWCHAKNKDALELLIQNNLHHCFFHANDNYTLTSNNIIWCNINVPLIKGSVCVLPEMGYNGKLEQCYGICSDVIKNYDSYRYK